MLKKTMALLLALCLVLSMAPATFAAQSGTCGADAYWSFDEQSGTLTVTGTGTVQDYRDVDTLLERPWESLRTKIRHLVIGEGITRVGHEAFSSFDNLETLSLPSTLEEIGNFTFTFAPKLKELELPEGLRAIGQQAFWCCDGLTEVYLPASITFMDAAMFDGCTGLKKVTIGADPGIPGFVIGNSPFLNCRNLEEIVVEEGHITLTAIDGVLYTRDAYGLTLLQYPLGKKAEEYIIPDDTYWVEQFSVDYATYLKRITVPASVEYIGAFAFGSSALESVRFLGSAPELTPRALGCLDLDVYYPAGDPTWTQEVMDSQYFLLNWHPYNPSNPFWDVPYEAYYEEPVLWALENSITSGTGPDEFSPYDSCLRSQVVTFLWRAVGEPKAKSAVNPFVDVKPSDYYYDAVLWAVEQGITTGADATHFEPNGVCNRSQVVTFLYRAFEKPPVDSAENPFTDVYAGDWYASAVLWAVQEGITNGLSETKFGPNDLCNRSQVVTFLYRAYE